jgi:hypothetical protein
LHDHPGRTEAALQRSSVEEGFLKCSNLGTRARGIDRGYVRTFRLNGQHEASSNHAIIDDNVASSADTVLAPYMAPGKR